MAYHAHKMLEFFSCQILEIMYLISYISADEDHEIMYYVRVSV